MTSPSPTVLIAGASRGLGAALAAEFAGRGWQVIGTVRGSERTELHDAADAHPGKIAIETLDIAAADEIATLRTRLAGRTIDILFVNAGMAVHSDKAAIGRISDADFAAMMLTNALAPIRLIEALGDLVPADGLIGAMTSGQGSIANNDNGREPIYRATKAALNMLMKSYAAQEAQRALLLLAPGWIRTALGGPDAPFTVAESAPLLAEIMIAKRARPGLEYLDRFGKTVPW